MRKKIALHRADVLTVAAILLVATIVAFAIVWLTYEIDYANVTVREALLFCLILLLFLTVGLYLYFTDISLLKSARKLMLICAVILASLTIVIIIIETLRITYAPLALCALLLTLFVGGGIAFFANIISVIILITAQWMYQPTFDAQMFFILTSSIVGGIIAASGTSKYNNRMRYIVIAGALGFATVSLYLLVYKLFSASFVWNTHTLWILVECFAAGFVNVMIFFVLTPLLEVAFNVLTNFRLAEITSTLHPLLKRLYKEAPGTFNHSLTVANYTEACAMAIGENTYLARAAAYYHDIGKLKNPQYFKENQLDGYNPHDEIPPELSTDFIRKHVINGYSLALEYKLPEPILDAIVQHHGTTLIKYFYVKASNYSEHELPEEDFSYNGTTPTTKIAAILMICDGCEAALRTLAADEKMKAEKVVADIIKERLLQKQFDNCPITMEDLNLISRTIVTTYMGVTHERIKYPEKAAKA